MATPDEHARMREAIHRQHLKSLSAEMCLWWKRVEEGSELLPIRHPDESISLTKPGWPVFFPFILTRDDVHFLQATGIKPE